MEPEVNELCKITLERFIEKAAQIQCKVVGTIKTIFKHKKYIVELQLSKEVVVRCFKRYNEFEALYELISMKYKNYSMGKFPSKFQILNKDDERKQYFQAMLTQIIKDHAGGDKLQETSRRLLSIVFLFLTSDIKPPKKKKTRSVTESFTEQDERGEVKSEDLDNCKNNNKAMTQEIQQRFLREVRSERKHRLSYEHPRDSAVTRPRCNSVENEFVSEVPEGKVEVNEFEVKFSAEDYWKKRYLVIKDSSLMLFSSKFDNYFRTQIQLYGMTVENYRRDKNIVDHFCEKMEFNLYRTFHEDPSIISLYHDHDYQKILIRKPLNTGQDPVYALEVLNGLKRQLIVASMSSPVPPDYDGVFNPIGKLFIFFHTLKLQWKKHSEDETIRILIRTETETFETRPIVYADQIKIVQGFLIPISSTFENFTIQCVLIKDEGWVKENTQAGKLMGSYSFNMTEFLTRPMGYLLNRMDIKLETAESKAEKYETVIEMSIENMSDFSSIYSDSFANEHDGKPLKGLKGMDDIGDLIVTVGRVLRVLGNIALIIQAFWRNVYLFKYPRMGYLFFSVLLYNALFSDIGDILKQFLIFVLLVIIYQQKHVNVIVGELLNDFIFCQLHRNFKPPQILSTGQVKYLKWSHNMVYIKEQYKMVDGRLEKAIQKPRTVFEFEVHGRRFTVKEEEQSIFEKFKEARKIIDLIHKMINSAINGIEKVANLLCWIDPKRTLFILAILLVFSGLASGLLIRAIVCLFCCHRFVKGLNFFDFKHYRNNRRFAVYSLSYIMHKHFGNIIGPRKDMSETELYQFLGQLIFPIHDEASQKKLKTEMEEIMGVYLEPEALYHKAEKKNCLKLIHIIDMVETCQSRLKLKWIPGPEGISNQFLQLKVETKEIPVIDVWVENSLINFILNIPSQLYTTMNQQHFFKVHRQKRKNEMKENKNLLDSETPKKTQDPLSTFVMSDQSPNSEE